MTKDEDPEKSSSGIQMPPKSTRIAGHSTAHSQAASSIARVLIVAGSDSCGGAGIQADLKTVTAFGAYGSTAITALTAQNTKGVFGVFSVPPDFVAQQITLILDDLGTDCIKTGMLVDATIITVLADILERQTLPIPLVVDPVMISKSGAALLDPAAIQILKDRLFPLATLVTPNIPEAEAFLGIAIKTEANQIEAAQALVELGCRAVLLKGGHMDSDMVTDILATRHGVTNFTARRLPGPAAHGTGCTLASAIAAGLAQGSGLTIAIRQARDFVSKAIATGPKIGAGYPLLNHAF
jgi:hydroxymethylpyrimidine/phosphomethylpyrimidine kinase